MTCTPSNKPRTATLPIPVVQLTKVEKQSKVSTKNKRKMGDYFCPDCGLSVTSVPLPFNHVCRPSTTLMELDRQDTCAVCSRNEKGICNSCLLKHPNKSCEVAYVYNQPSVVCPERYWLAVELDCPKCGYHLCNPRGVDSCRKCGWQGDKRNRIDVSAVGIKRPALGRIETRNLMYHVFPAGDWKSIVDEIAEHRSIFNGKRVVAVADHRKEGVAHAVQYCKEAFKTDDILVITNNRQLREAVTFLPMLNKVLNNSPHEATFYAHTKANSTASNVDGAVKWRKTMVASLLGRWEDAMKHLERYYFVGTHKMIWPSSNKSPFPSGLRPKNSWMHSGTFWWFRHEQVHSLVAPDSLAMDRYGVEAWPSQLIPHTDAYSMWQPWRESVTAWPPQSPYDPNLYSEDHSQ